MNDTPPSRNADTKPAAEPVADSELAGLFDHLARYQALVLAVSGGPDSVALMVLVARWLKRRPEPPRVEVVTVDHALRAASAAEARRVGEQAGALGFTHRTLLWSEGKPASGIQDAARAARYRLIGDHARSLAERPVAIVTAHTADDQAETLLMRLARGSGVDGLSAMRRSRSLGDDPGIMLERPLLGIEKRRLIATLEAAGLDWMEDPSNARPDFERARLREAAGVLAALGLTADKLALSAARLLRAREALDAAADDLCAAAVDIHGGIHATIDLQPFLAAPAELRLRLLARVLTAFGGESRPARLTQVEALMEALSSPRDPGSRPLAVTLGGSIVRTGPRAIHVFRECDPGELPALMLAPGESAIWDGRFRVGLAAAEKLAAAAVAGPVTVRALGAGAYATLRTGLARARFPARAAAALPSFWVADRLIGVPQLEALGLPQFAPETVCASQFVAWTPTTAARGPENLG